MAYPLRSTIWLLPVMAQPQEGLELRGLAAVSETTLKRRTAEQLTFP